METAIGFQFKENFRVEVLVSGQETSDFTGQANFTGVIGAQPVSASLSQQSILFALYRDIDSIPSLRSAGLVPYLGLGAGLTRHELSSVSFLFPGLTQPSWSLTPDGTHHAMTLMVTAGLNYSLSEHLSIDFSYRYQDSGKARTSAGMMTNQRGGAPFTIGIDSIYTRVRAQQIMAGLRYQF
jgi:opacity protein-like surface antigen